MVLTFIYPASFIRKHVSVHVHLSDSARIYISFLYILYTEHTSIGELFMHLHVIGYIADYDVDHQSTVC